ncbi:hypothetical protein [Sphingomonas panacis]|uniref:hypothetical protein n=1 Tax=Sphingomonas panacis TaxID=1560345 RepID=UPI0012370F99|nr:hypothetical protein [Sphingomonas panacis]
MFDGTREWTAADRNLVSGRKPGELEQWIDLPAGKIAARFRYMEIFDAQGRELDAKAVMARVGAEIIALPLELRRTFLSKIDRSMRNSRMEVAHLIAAALGDLHMLSQTPEPPPFNLSMGAASGVPSVVNPHDRTATSKPAAG